MANGNASIKGYNCNVSQGLVIVIPLPDFRFVRLLPLVVLVLTTRSITIPEGPGKSPNPSQWRQRRQDVHSLNQYQTHGAFAYISDQQKMYAHFFWQQAGQDRCHLLPTSPLGSMELELNAQSGNVQLVDNKGQCCVSDNAEEITGKLTGMPIPFNSLHRWILGLPGDATGYKLDDQYRLNEITYNQNGKDWKVVYDGYDTKTQPAIPTDMEPTDGGQRIKLEMDNRIMK